jgi:group II intron reverse transcriptase/maturase
LLEGKTTETPISETRVSTRLQRIAELAKEAPERAFLSLAHHIDIEVLREAFRRTRKDGAPGVDGQTGRDYEERLEENLQQLLDRFKSGRYKAPPVRRSYIPKGDGSQRPLGIPTFEDKVLQRAVAMVLEAVYEQSFLDCSHGYRPGRSAHTALAQLQEGLRSMGGGWVLELDIKSFFDTLEHRHLRSILDQRVRDGVLRRSIDKWLAAGVLEGAVLSHPDAGTPQGGVISPLLANVYLHEVLDLWFERDVRPRLRGRGFLVRYADDAVLVLSDEVDARQALSMLPERFGRYGLTLHPNKTRLLSFRPPRRDDSPPPPSGKARSFDFLGFRHHWAKSRQGGWVIRQRTASDRFTRALKRLSTWCRMNRHGPVRWQHQQLVWKLRGHDNYYGLSGNYGALQRFHHAARRVWRRWLHRRSQKARMGWERFAQLLERYPWPRPRLLAARLRAAKSVI